MMDRPTKSPRLLSVMCALFLFLVIAACGLQNRTPQPSIKPSPQPTNGMDSTPPEGTQVVTQAPENCVDLQGTVEEIDIPSALLGEEIRVKIYLPLCYSSNLNVTYSTLYMLHGQMSQYDQWEKLGMFSQMDKLVEENRVEPFLIVLPDETKSNLDSYSSKYGEALVNEVIPYIEKNYRVCTERSCRAIGGLSRGGNWAVHLGFMYPQTFVAVGAHSAPLFYGELSNLYRIALDPEALKDLPIFYLDVGDRDEDREDVLLFLSILEEFGLPHNFFEFLGYHDESYWRSHVQDYLLWYDSQLAP